MILIYYIDMLARFLWICYRFIVISMLSLTIELSVDEIESRPQIFTLPDMGNLSNRTSRATCSRFDDPNEDIER